MTEVLDETLLRGQYYLWLQIADLQEGGATREDLVNVLGEARRTLSDPQYVALNKDVARMLNRGTPA